MTSRRYLMARIPPPSPHRDGPRYVSPLGDRRESSVLCRRCRRSKTWALDSLCDPCAEGAPEISPPRA